MENPLWKCEEFTKAQAWIDILLLANHAGNIMHIKNGEMVTVNRGECGVSVLGFSRRWGWSRGKVTRFFSYLKSQKMIQQKNDKNITITIIINYDQYQTEQQAGQQTIQQTIQQTGQQTDINKNDKNEKNEKNGKNKDIYCTELSLDSSMQEAVPCFIELILNDGSGYGITENEITQWSALYPAVDIRQDLRKMAGWLLSNPKNRKTRRGIMKFINSWLSKSQDSARPNGNSQYISQAQKRLNDNMAAGQAFIEGNF